MDKADLIRQVDWLLERLDTRGVLRVLSVANRLFVTQSGDHDEECRFPGAEGVNLGRSHFRRVNTHPERDRPNIERQGP